MMWPGIGPEMVWGLGLAGSALVAAAVSLAVSPNPAKAAPDSDEPCWVFVGTYTGGEGGSRGIYRMTFDPATGKLSDPELAAEATNPTFLAVHPTRRFLYAVGEIGNFQGQSTGSVSAYALDAAAGKLDPLNTQSSQGAGPCFVTVDRAGKNVLVANYSGGSVAVLPIGDDGKLSEATDSEQHSGSSVDPRRQQGPHAHSINLDPANRFAIAADLGLDQLLVYRFDGEKGTLTPNDPPFATVPPGGGPRHFAFHPDGRHAYAINEMGSTITAFTYDADRGVLESYQTISTLPEGFEGSNTTAEVVVHPTGRFVYGSNRGHDSIAIFAVEPETGKLRPLGHQSTGGKTPRNFNIDPTGRYLLAANQDTHNILVFRLDPDTGRLEPTGQEVQVGRPVCIKFVTQEK